MNNGEYKALADKISSPLPQLVKNIDTGELADTYSIHVSSAERDFLVTALRFADAHDISTPAVIAEQKTKHETR